MQEKGLSVIRGVPIQESKRTVSLFQPHFSCSTREEEEELKKQTSAEERV